MKLACFLATLMLPPFVVAADTRILIVVGPSAHPPGTHEVAAGGRLMKWALENMSNLPGFQAEIVTEWPKNPSALRRFRSLVFTGDTFPPQRMPERESMLKQIGEAMKRGTGIACVHYATGLRAEDVSPTGEHPLLVWLGGYFATKGVHHQSVAKVFPSVAIKPAAPRHPVSRGWREFIVTDEPYYNNYFGPNGNQPAAGVTPFATAMLPPESPKPEIVSWGVQRADGGRGFAAVIPHFYKNWANEDMRRFLLNGIVWTARREVPAEGVRTPAPDLAAFQPESVEPRPRNPGTAVKK